MRSVGRQSGGAVAAEIDREPVEETLMLGDVGRAESVEADGLDLAEATDDIGLGIAADIVEAPEARRDIDEDEGRVRSFDRELGTAPGDRAARRYDLGPHGESERRRRCRARLDWCRENARVSSASASVTPGCSEVSPRTNETAPGLRGADPNDNDIVRGRDEAFAGEGDAPLLHSVVVAIAVSRSSERR